MYVEEEHLRAITGAVWESMLGALPLPCDAYAWGDARFLSGIVEIESEGRSLSVVVHTTLTGAGRAANAMFARAAPSIEDMRDALGELTNVIGGNVKALFPIHSRLSLPATVVPEHALTLAPSSVDRVWFDWEGEPLLVEVLASEGAASHSTMFGP